MQISSQFKSSLKIKHYFRKKHYVRIKHYVGINLKVFFPRFQNSFKGFLSLQSNRSESKLLSKILKDQN